MFRLYSHAGIVFLVVCSTLYLVAGGVEAFPPPQAPEQKGTSPPGLLNTYSPQSQTAPNPTVTSVTSLRSPPSLLGTRPGEESGGAVTDDSAEVLRPVAVQTSRPTSSGIPTGGDNCNETTPNAVAVPGAISIFGDNSAATGPDDCTGFNMGTIWWESFTITQCADVEITFCGSNPKIPSNWIFVTESCSADGSTCFGLFGASAANRAVCADENIWMLIEGLPAGTYYYPIISSTTSNYQMKCYVLWRCKQVVQPRRAFQREGITVTRRHPMRLPFRVLYRSSETTRRQQGLMTAPDSTWVRSGGNHLRSRNARTWRSLFADQTPRFLRTGFLLRRVVLPTDPLVCTATGTTEHLFPTEPNGSQPNCYQCYQFAFTAITAWHTSRGGIRRRCD